MTDNAYPVILGNHAVKPLHPATGPLDVCGECGDDWPCDAHVLGGAVVKAMADLAWVLAGPVDETQVPTLERAFNTLKEVLING